jgi:putative transposase
VAGAAEVFPTTREQRCWVHVVRNVLGALPKSVHAGARRALNEIILAEDRTHAERAIDTFAADYGIKWPRRSPRSPAKPSGYCASSTIRPSTGSTCAPRIPSRVRSPRSGPGPGSPRAGHQGHGAGDGVQAAAGGRGRWRAVNGPHLVALVRAGARFDKGKLIERPDETPDKEADGDVTKVAA